MPSSVPTMRALMNPIYLYELPPTICCKISGDGWSTWCRPGLFSIQRFGTSTFSPTLFEKNIFRTTWDVDEDIKDAQERKSHKQSKCASKFCHLRKICQESMCFESNGREGQSSPKMTKDISGAPPRTWAAWHKKTWWIRLTWSCRTPPNSRTQKSWIPTMLPAFLEGSCTSCKSW